jgi:tRNA pseudouridine38-40 synthase
LLVSRQASATPLSAFPLSAILSFRLSAIFPIFTPMRWKIHLSYLGTAYCGWQRQPGDPSVQQTLEEAFSLILRQHVEIVGCGRTDTGVHARNYVAHADIQDIEPTDKVLYQLNAVLPHDIALQSIEETGANFHARFDAVERHYQYFLHFYKDPFARNQSHYFQHHTDINQVAMQEAASMLLMYQHFQPFCKTGSDADHFKCNLTESRWTFDMDHAVYSIKANRFLRGMVRLVVGACLNVGLGKITVDQLNESMDLQTLIPHAWSVPAEGLFLENVTY